MRFEAASKWLHCAAVLQLKTGWEKVERSVANTNHNEQPLACAPLTLKLSFDAKHLTKHREQNKMVATTVQSYRLLCRSVTVVPN